jgi:hypothetical protein
MLKKYAQNLAVVNQLIDVARNSLREHYFQAIRKFLEFNTAPKSFQQVQLLNNFFMRSGGTIWSDVRATELSHILTEIEKMDGSYRYVQHKAYLRKRILSEKKQAEDERIRKFISDRW